MEPKPDRNEVFTKWQANGAMTQGEIALLEAEEILSEEFPELN